MPHDQRRDQMKIVFIIKAGYLFTKAYNGIEIDMAIKVLLDKGFKPEDISITVEAQ